MEDFRHKAWLVACGHVTKTTSSITYASVLSQETVRIIITIDTQNDLQVKAYDIQNTYI